MKDLLTFLKDVQTQIVIIPSIWIGIIIATILIVRYWKPIKRLVASIETLESINMVQQNIQSELARLAIETIPNGSNQIRKVNDEIFKISATVSSIEAKVSVGYRLSNACMFECDAEGLCVSANPALCELFGAHEEEMLGFGWIKFLHNEDTERVAKNWHRAVKSKQHELNDEYRLVHPKTKVVTRVKYRNIWRHDSVGNIISSSGVVYLADSKSRELQALECIADAVKDLKGTKLWADINNHLNKKKDG